MSASPPLVLVRGGGDLGSGVAARLHRCGFGVVVTEIERPLAVRRLVAFAEAVYRGQVLVEEILGKNVESCAQARQAVEARQVAVLVDPAAACGRELQPIALIDARMRKRPPEKMEQTSLFIVGLGPGFTAGENCHAAVETNRGHYLGRVLWMGSPQPDTGLPEAVGAHQADRVLRAPQAGVLQARVMLGERVRKGDVLATVGDAPVRALFDGALRGLMHDGLQVEGGLKIGDLDPRADPAYCALISDKALAVGGGVLEALLSQPAIRRGLGA